MAAPLRYGVLIYIGLIAHPRAMKGYSRLPAIASNREYCGMSVTNMKVSASRKKSSSIKRFVDDDVEEREAEMILTSIELAKYLRVRRNTIYKLLRENKIPGFRVGSEWRFSSRQIDRWIISQQRQELLQAIHA